jgi:TolB protein
LLTSGPVGAEDHVGVYVINVIGASIRKLRDDARGAAISPDGTRILFTAKRPPEVMVMTADGEQARTIVPGVKEDQIYQPSWSPDGQRILYVRIHQTAKDPEVKLESRDVEGGTPVVVFTNPDLRGFRWLPGNRLVFGAMEPSPHRDDMNLWELSLDPKTGAARGKPRKMTEWAGFAFWHLSATSDGKRLAFVNGHEQGDVYVGELDKGGTQMKPPVRLTLSEKNDWPGGWTRDGKTILFYSNRNGNFDLYRQKVGERSAEAMGTAPEEKRSPQLSPDGAWTVYLSWPHMPNEAQPASGRLMRLPVTGGPPEPIFEVKGYATWGNPGDAQRNVGEIPGFRCVSSGKGSCVLAEGDEVKKKITFTLFDPAQGKKGATANVEVPEEPAWALSPDGSRVAITWFDTQGATIRIVPLDGGSARDLIVKNCTEFVNLAWAADGKSLFAIRNSSKGSLLLHVELNGESQVLYRAGWDVVQITPSPDGHFLAYGAVNSNSTVWTIPNLPEP